MRKELDDYVRQSLDALTDDGVDWEQFDGLVGSLVDKVAAMCESNMDAQHTSRPVNPNQGWRWRQQRGNQSRTAPRQPQASGSSDAPPEDRQRGERRRQGGHHGARNRRNHAARQRYNGPEVQRLQRSFRRNRKRCVAILDCALCTRTALSVEIAPFYGFLEKHAQCFEGAQNMIILEVRIHLAQSNFPSFQF